MATTRTHRQEADTASGTLPAVDPFAPRHLGPNEEDVRRMLGVVGYESLDALIDATVPGDIRLKQPLNLPPPATEHEALDELRGIAGENRVMRSMIGMGYHGTITPAVIRRNILENPLWYTPYTPYQAEISQGRLGALLNFQTMAADLTGLPLANASLLDETTAAAEAMVMCYAIAGGPRGKKPVFLVAEDCHPQTINVVRTRARSMGVELRLVDVKGGSPRREAVGFEGVCGVLVQYPTTDGRVEDYAHLCAQAHEAGALVVAACDILALVLLKPPGEWGADIAVGSTQRFGVPMGFGGPHAAYLATYEKHARKMPGRIVGVSKDAHGNPALRLAIQTREQHIKRDRATSNICTAQVLPAVIAAMYAVWHGPEGLKRIASRVQLLTCVCAEGFRRIFEAAAAPSRVVNADACFDAITIEMADRECVLGSLEGARELGVNMRDFGDNRVGITLDETTTIADVRTLWKVSQAEFSEAEEAEIIANAREGVTSHVAHRTSDILTHPVFDRYHSEHEFLRYVTRLQSRDISLANSMIPLGSCTMKLNAAAEMIPVTWPGFADMHPYAPPEQAAGYARLFSELEAWLREITGFAAVSLQPNAGSQGEYAGLLAIRGYHESRGDQQRKVCLIPTSAHGTNPASAVIAGFEVVAVKCDGDGNIDTADLRARAEQHKDALAALMVTYPSTHGVFEESVREVCDIVHAFGGQVYMDGANMNAQVGLCRPADIGADVCHLNLHKTFCIPHGGGGPGMGPIAVAEHLAPFLPGDPLANQSNTSGGGPVSAAPYGSPMILPISWMYIRMMGAAGLTRATQVAILNANYIARRLAGHYDVLYTGRSGTVAHEGIIDCRPFEKSAGIRVEDIAKRLIDFGFHAPTMSWPVAGTLMIEPTESESKAELDRFCDALIAIRKEIADVEADRVDRDDNALKHSPHTAAAVSADHWPHSYPRQQAAYPAEWQRVEPDHKYWPPVGRVDNAYGDRHLVCTCISVEDAAQ